MQHCSNEYIINLASSDYNLIIVYQDEIKHMIIHYQATRPTAVSIGFVLWSSSQVQFNNMQASGTISKQLLVPYPQTNHFTFVFPHYTKPALTSF